MSFKKPLNLLYFVLTEGQSVQKQGLVLYMTGASKAHTRTTPAGEGTGLASSYSVCYVAPCPADTMPIGVAYKTTMNYRLSTAANPTSSVGAFVWNTGVEIGVVREGEVKVPYSIGNNVAIACGDILSMKDAITVGHVNLHTPTGWPAVYSATTAATIKNEQAYVVGIAKEPVTASTASQIGYLQILLAFHVGASAIA